MVGALTSWQYTLGVLFSSAIPAPTTSLAAAVAEARSIAAKAFS
jgi:hypothetical protein